MENFESIGCARRARKLCGAAHWEATYARGRKCENALELRRPDLTDLRLKENWFLLLINTQHTHPIV